MATAVAPQGKGGEPAVKSFRPRRAPAPTEEDTVRPPATSTASPAENKPPMDIYQYLNGEQRDEMLRDPILQQMAVVRYEGELDASTGFFHGQGKLVSTLGYSYVGNFVKGLMHGQGKIVWNDGTAYEGEFVNNTISGTGKYTWPNGDTYEGDVQLHVRHGKGNFYFKALDERYEGDWWEGLRHGKGTLVYSDRCVFRGDWVRDRRTGRGVMQYEDGSVYDGEWFDDVRHGDGQMKWMSGGAVVEEYHGQWLHGTPSGRGTSIYTRPPREGGSTPQSPSNVVDAATRDTALNAYTGEFQNGLRHGFGTFVYDDGSRYEGMWANNLKHGEGKFTNANGVIFVGVFCDGAPVEPMADAKPDTTVASPVPLYIRDVLTTLETNEGEAILAVQSVVSRHHGQLRRTFLYYASMEVGVEVLTTPPDWKAQRTQGTLHMIQFIRFCNDSKLINRHLTVAAIDRLLLNFKDMHETTSPSVYLAAADGPPAKTATSPPAAALAINSVNNSPERKPSSNSQHSGGKGSTAALSSVMYAAPWERYRTELHQFTGELNFREFVEAIVRIAAALYVDPVYGTVAQRVQLVIDEHITPFACNVTNAAPFCKMCRENRYTLSKYIEPIQHCFTHFAHVTATGVSGEPNTTSVGLSQSPVQRKIPDVAITVRQLALMLQQAGLLQTSDSSSARASPPVHPLTISKLLRIIPYDKYPAFTAAVYRKVFLRHALHQAAPTPQPPRQSHGSSQQPYTTPERASLAPPSTATSQQHLLLATATQSTSNLSFQSMLEEAQSATAVLEAEAALNVRLAMQAKSRGRGGKNFKSTVCMDAELTLCEFAEALLQVAMALSTEGTVAQRFSALMVNHVLPLVKALPPIR